jgi:hypothetical protein
MSIFRRLKPGKHLSGEKLKNHYNYHKMKKKALLLLLSATMSAAVCKAGITRARSIYHQQPVADTLLIYTGKYQRVVHNDLFYIQFEVVDGNLVGSTLWDGNKLLLKHLSGDNFIVSGVDWGVKFVRDKDGKIGSVIVRGTDEWTRVKN